MPAQRTARQLGDLPCQLDAGRAGADDRERQPRLARGGVGLELGDLESTEDPPAQLERVVDRLHPGRVKGVLVVTEVRLRRPARDDQAVVGQRRRLPQRVDRQLPVIDVHVDDLAEDDARIALMSQYVADRRRDVALGEYAGGDLVEQGLEEVVVGAVDHNHLDWRAAQRLGGEQPGEPATDDDDAVHDSDRRRRLGTRPRHDRRASSRCTPRSRAP